VVVPVLNNAATLPAQLDALLAQDYDGPFEILVVDNGSEDASIRLVEERAVQNAKLRLVDASSQRGVNHARNVGSAAAAGELIAYCDGDDVADKSWLSALVERAVDCDVVGGRIDVELLNEPTAIKWRTEPPNDRLPVALGFLPYGLSANLAIWVDALSAVGGWDENFVLGATEVDICWRLQLRSYKICFAPDAVIHYRLRNKMTGLVRQGLRYGRGDVRLYRKFRQHGIERNGWRFLAITWARLIRSGPDLWRSREARGRWLNLVAFRFGRMWASLRYRTLFL
jgi:glycosyltransferase involved in cell wall biosynthesis